VKIIALFDPTTIADFLALRMMGADDVLKMPISLEELLLAVDKVLHEEA
jgi:DNA-binding response OmpR family regulator